MTTIRPTGLDDIPFLEQMLLEAFFWRPDQPRPDIQAFTNSSLEFQKLLRDWGRPGDSAVIAEANGQPVGAAWFRFWTDQEHSYGYVNPKTPEIGIAVHPDWRSQGLGRAILKALLEAAQRQGVEQISLSVEPEKYARKLYESEGFVKVDQVDGSWTMLFNLGKR